MGPPQSPTEAQMIQKNVALNDWQIAEIKKGLAEADRGNFATEKEVKQTVEKWKRREG